MSDKRMQGEITWDMVVNYTLLVCVITVILYYMVWNVS